MLHKLQADGHFAGRTVEEDTNLNRIVLPGVGALKLGEVSTPRLDYFDQQVMADRAMRRRR